MQHTGLTDFTFALDFLFSRHVHIYIFRSSCVCCCRCYTHCLRVLALLLYGTVYNTVSRIRYSIDFICSLMAFACEYFALGSFVMYVTLANERLPTQRTFTSVYLNRSVLWVALMALLLLYASSCTVWI